MFSPIVLDKFEGLATRWKPEKAPPGRLLAALNCRLSGDKIGPRPGLSQAFSGPDSTASINSLGSFLDASGKYVIVGLDSAGNHFATNPYPGDPVDSVITLDPPYGNVLVSGTGSQLQLIAEEFPIGTDKYFDFATAYDKIFMAISDLQSGGTSIGARQYYWNETLSKYRYAGVGTNPNQTPITAVASSGTTGDIEVGTRYAIVLFQTETGFISGWRNGAIKRIDVSTADEQLTLTGIPVGPASSFTRRIIAFTEAGATSDGPYFYIPEDQFVEGLNAAVVGGVNITKTVIEDNATTTLTVTFPDETLLASVDVTTLLDKAAGPGDCKSIFYSKSLRRLITCGEDASTFRISEPDDPESFFLTTGLNKPGEGDGGDAMTAREYRGELYFLKDNGGHLVIDSSLTPAEWKTVPRWSSVGPCGPLAVDVADGADGFIAFASRAGAYIYRGNGPEWLSYEISGDPKQAASWDRINWDYRHLIYCVIDHVNKLLRFGVPLDDSTKINAELICDYSDGLKATQRIWHLDDAACGRTLRTETDPTTLSLGSVLLFPSNANDGLVLYEDSNNLTLNGAAFLQKARLAYTPFMKIPGIYRLNALDITAGGTGNGKVTVYGDKGAVNLVSPDLAFEGIVEDFGRKNHSVQSERFSIEITNGGELGNYFELLRVTLWISKIWDTRSV